MFFILRVSGGALSIDAKRHIWFTGRASIFAFLLLLLYYWGLYCGIMQLNFSLKHYSNGTLNDCVFESVNFWVVMGNSNWKSQISNITQNVDLVVIPRPWPWPPHFLLSKDFFYIIINESIIIDNFKKSAYFPNENAESTSSNSLRMINHLYTRNMNK